MSSWNALLGTLVICLLPLLDAAPVEDSTDVTPGSDPGEYLKYLMMTNDELQQVAETLRFRLMFIKELQNIKANQPKFLIPVEQQRHKRFTLPDATFALTVENSNSIIIAPYCQMNAQDKLQGNPSTLLPSILIDMTKANMQGIFGVKKMMCLGKVVSALGDLTKNGTVSLSAAVVQALAESPTTEKAPAKTTTVQQTTVIGNATAQIIGSGNSSSDSGNSSSNSGNSSSDFGNLSSNSSTSVPAVLQKKEESNDLDSLFDALNKCKECQPDAFQIVNMKVDMKNGTNNLVHENALPRIP